MAEVTWAGAGEGTEHCPRCHLEAEAVGGMTRWGQGGDSGDPWGQTAVTQVPGSWHRWHGWHCHLEDVAQGPCKKRWGQGGDSGDSWGNRVVTQVPGQCQGGTGVTGVTGGTVTLKMLHRGLVRSGGDRDRTRRGQW